MTTKIRRLLVSALKSIEQETAAETAPRQPPSRRGKKAVVAHVEPEVAWQLKKLAVDGQTTVQKLLEEALSDLFHKYHLPRC